MAGYQILGVRSFFDEKEKKQKKYDAFFDKRWRVDDLADVFRSPQATLDRLEVPPGDRWNLFYTLNFSGDGKREFKRLEWLAFDLDGIKVERKEEYIEPVLGVLGVKKENAVVVYSGNGLHFLFRLHPAVEDKKFFDEMRPQYKGICERINRELERLRLPGKADTVVFEGARILRMPGTINRKPDKQDPSKIVDKLAEVLVLGDMKPIPFDFEKVSGVKKLGPEEAISADELRRYKKADGKAAFENCLFLQHVEKDAARLPEPEWYAAASIIGRFENGKERFHEVSRTHPGYRHAETEEKLKQAMESSGPRTCSNINALWGGCKDCPLYEKIKSPVVIFGKDVIPTEATGFYDIIVGPQGVKKVPNFGDLLKAFKREHAYKMIVDMKAVYTFNGTHYVDCSPFEIKGFAERVMEPKPKDKDRQEFLHKVLANELARRSFFHQGTDNRINFANGVLDLATSTLLPHSPEYGFRSAQPYAYDPNAKCPTFDWWIRDIMLGDEDLVKILQEFMGYVVRGGEYKYHKALWLAGSGRNGKSTFIHVLKALIGTENYATLSIKQIIQDKFASSSLDGKIANFSEETSPEELADSGPFKNLTGDGEINAQKKYGDPYQFRNRAKLIMTYNEVPLLKDLSPGMLSRPIIVPFKKDLTAEGAQDRNLKDKLLAELPGIFNFALEGWRRLEAQGGFTESEKSKLELEEIREASCSAAQWVKENVEFLPNETPVGIKSRSLYEAYKEDIGKFAYSENKFSKRIAALPGMAARRRRTNVGWEYVGIRLRNGLATSPLRGEY